MVTYFNIKDLASFGNYLLSRSRISRFVESHKERTSLEFDDILNESLEKVHHADVENWLEEQKSK